MFQLVIIKVVFKPLVSSRWFQAVGFKRQPARPYGKVCKLFEWLGRAETVRVFFPDAGECTIALNGAGMNPVSGQWEQKATFHDWPGPVDYLLRDDFLSQSSRRVGTPAAYFLF